MNQITSDIPRDTYEEPLGEISLISKKGDLGTVCMKIIAANTPDGFRYHSPKDILNSVFNQLNENLYHAVIFCIDNEHFSFSSLEGCIEGDGWYLLISQIEERDEFGEQLFDLCLRKILEQNKFSTIIACLNYIRNCDVFEHRLNEVLRTIQELIEKNLATAKIKEDERKYFDLLGTLTNLNADHTLHLLLKEERKAKYTSGKPKTIEIDGPPIVPPVPKRDH